MASFKTIEQKYQKKTQHEHILSHPDTYIGSIEGSECECWVWDDENQSMVKKIINVNLGLYKIFDEILVNAADHYVRIRNQNIEHKVTQMKVEINAETNEISVYNNGEGIDIEVHKEYNLYVPELIFGHLLTSTNYDAKEEKITGGKNGYGAKLTNIYSTKFTIETIDSIRQKKFVQVYENNMLEKTKPKITKCTGKPYTKITFQPDLKRFGLKKLSNDQIAMMQKRVIDMTACTGNDVSIYLNGQKLIGKDFESYVNYYIGPKSEQFRIYEKINDRWEVCVTESDDAKLEQVSFVNGIYTFKGGKHVDAMAQKVSTRVSKYLSEKGKKKINVKANFIRENMFLFLKSTIVNPAFDSQTKEYLTTVASKFGSKFEVSDKFIEKVAKSNIIQKAVQLGEFKDNSATKKTDGKKKSQIKGIPKLDDAVWAGTSKSSQCTLVLTEGDSAKAFAISGISVIGREKYGVFPLKGKLLNVMDAAVSQLNNNTEISALKKIMGLQQFETSNKKKVYKNISELRYGRIMILTDADVDGSHIKGLLINFIAHFWPELLEFDEHFIECLITPIIKAKKGKTIKSFYTQAEYDNWKEHQDIGKWKIKYYKGLGTSTSIEAKEYFSDLNKHLIEYRSNGDTTNSAIQLAFNKTKANDRKVWLSNYDKNVKIENNQKEVFIEDFINKELIHFSNYDNHRSIPSMIDGLKPSQRKIIYSVLKKNQKSEIKVAQLSGYVSETSAYHHGENSLNEAIINLAQNFVGSNNINLLEPIGQFGTRLCGGKDYSSPRYIFTQMSKLMTLLFNSNDNPLLNYLDDDGTSIEPEYYVPIIPMILVNGARGIGTGYSTHIPSFNPQQCIDYIKNKLKDKSNTDTEFKPWYAGFTGTIEPEDETKKRYITKGCYKILEKGTVEITELPIGEWTDHYKEHLEKIMFDSGVKTNKEQVLSAYKNLSSDVSVKFELRFPQIILNKITKKTDKFEKLMKLTSTLSMTNLHAYNSDNKINKYENVNELIDEYYNTRLNFYKMRKEYLENKLQRELNLLNAKIRFIYCFMNEEIKIFKKDEEEIEEQLIILKFPKFNSKVNDKDIAHKRNIEMDEEGNFDYLINMSIRTLTNKKMKELEQQRDNKKIEHESVCDTSYKQMWLDDLKEFEKEYNKFVKNFEKEIAEKNSIKSVTKKLKVKKINKK